MDITVTITNLTNSDLNDFCILEETSNNLYVDIKNNSIEITNPTDFQLQVIPDFGSRNVKIKANHEDKINLVHKQINLKSKLT